MRTRTYGWIQNPSDFQKLKIVTQIFNSNSTHYNNLKKYIIKDQIIYFDEIKRNFMYKFNNSITEFTYIELVGTSKNKYNKSPKKRSNAEANGLIQISILPQNAKTKGKLYTDNWTSDGYLRWAVSLNFLKVDREHDTFSLTKLGKSFSETKDNSKEEHEILKNALLAYPPAVQVLKILNEDNQYHTKFYIGDQLGFRGEKGFTSYNQEVMTDWLKKTSSIKEFKSIKSDVEGTSDKYARMICNWLIKIGLVQRSNSKVIFQGKVKNGFPVYGLTKAGRYEYNHAQGYGSSKGTIKEKYIMWEFLATELSNRDYVRTRRGLILQYIQKTKSFNELVDMLEKKGFNDDPEIIENDIKGLNTFGLNIDKTDDLLIFNDTINDFEIPNISVTQTMEDEANSRIKAKFIKLTNLPIKYIELLDIAYNPKRNRDFEIITTELFKYEYGFNAIHLGGGRKPDGVVFNSNIGIIVDTKAYSRGYSKNITEADKMIRYIEDNKKRSKKRNPNIWWNEFDSRIPEDNFYFLWVSSKFVGRFDEQLSYTASQTNTTGGALNVEQLLLGADAIKKGEITKEDIPKYLDNREVKFI